jgi:hypothetical protein
MHDPRPVWTVDLSPRENRHVESSLVRDVADLCLGASLLLVLYVIAWLVMW